MISKKASQLIRKALDGAKIVATTKAAGPETVSSDASTPTASALLRKYGGAPALSRSRAYKPNALDAIDASAADLEEAIVEFKTTKGVPARLGRRTVTINKNTGKIESMSG